MTAWFVRFGSTFCCEPFYCVKHNRVSNCVHCCYWIGLTPWPQIRRKVFLEQPRRRVQSGGRGGDRGSCVMAVVNRLGGLGGSSRAHVNRRRLVVHRVRCTRLVVHTGSKLQRADVAPRASGRQPRSRILRMIAMNSCAVVDRASQASIDLRVLGEQRGATEHVMRTPRRGSASNCMRKPANASLLKKACTIIRASTRPAVGPTPSVPLA